VERTLAFGSRTTADIMTPRVRMHSVDAQACAADVVALTMATGHSRFPVIDASPDEVVGAIHIKHAVAVTPDARGHTPVNSILQTGDHRPGEPRTRSLAHAAPPRRDADGCRRRRIRRHCRAS